MDGLAAQGTAHVEGDAALVAIETPEDGALTADVLHVHAREIARAGTLDLDDVRAEVSEHLRRAWPHLDLREVEDGDAVERLHAAHRPDHRDGRFSRNAFTPSS